VTGAVNPREILKEGQQILDAVLVPHGFVFKQTAFGKSSGGDYASGRYEREDRHLDIHFRHSLGLVTYHAGALVISHEAYMRSLLGPQGGNRYPSFSDDPLEAFRCLAFDLKTFGSDFLSGAGEEFARCVRIAQDYEGRPGFSRMAEFES
jgi:hypothetical protein